MAGKWFALKWAAVFVSLIVFACISGCGNSQHFVSGQTQTARNLETPAINGLPDLGMAAREVSYTPGRFRHGSDHAPVLSRYVAVDGDNLEFRPKYSPDYPYHPSDLAFAVYPFTFPLYDDIPQIHLEWAVPPLDSSLWYVGVSNWETNAWQWFSGEVYSKITTEGTNKYINSEGRLLVLVLVSGDAYPELNSIYFGRPVDELEYRYFGKVDYFGWERDQYSFTYEITLQFPPFDVELDCNYDPNAVYGNELASFGMNYPRNIVPLEQDLSRSGIHQSWELVRAILPDERLFAVRITDSLGQQQLVWSQIPYHIDIEPSELFIVEDVRQVGFNNYEIDLLFELSGVPGSFDVYLDPDYNSEYDENDPLAKFGDLWGEIQVGNYATPGFKTATVNFSVDDSGPRIVALRWDGNGGNIGVMIARETIYLPPLPD